MRYDRATARRGESYVIDKRGESSPSGAPNAAARTLARVQAARRSAGNGTGLSALAGSDVQAGVRKKKIRRAVKRS